MTVAGQRERRRGDERAARGPDVEAAGDAEVLDQEEPRHERADDASDGVEGVEPGDPSRELPGRRDDGLGHRGQARPHQERGRQKEERTPGRTAPPRAPEACPSRRRKSAG